MEYLSLHLHTIKSIGDSIVTIEKLIDKAKEFNLNALSITNHGTMSDCFEFYKECKDNDIKPIIGCEIYVRKNAEETDDKKKKREYYHLVLIAKNQNGYKNLLKIHNYGHLQGFYYKPLVDEWVLKAYGKDIICLSACVGGEIPKLILEGINASKEEVVIYEKAIYEKIDNYKNWFDEFYLEIQPGDFEEQRIVNETLIWLSQKTNTPLIITNDVHYIDKENYKAHNVHVCANQKNNDPTKLIYPDICYFMMDDATIKSAINIESSIFKQCIKNINHVVSIIEDYDIIPKDINMPIFEVPKNYTEDTYLEKICIDKLNSMVLKIKDPAVYSERLMMELDVISKLKFSGYFLVVRDYILYAKNEDIEVGPGRGSVCGSLVAYLCELTVVDPIRFNLLFERFLSEHRVSPPDVDTDFMSEGRDKVFNYVVSKYGNDKCALVSTFSLRKSKSAIKDTGRVYGIEREIYEYVASLIPEVYYIDDEDGGSEKKTDLSIEETIELVPEFKEYANKYPEWFKSASELSNIPKATSVHAAGTLISPVALEKHIPLIRSKHDTINATALNLSDAELAGFIKYDFLGLASLGVIHKIKKMIGIKDVYEFIDDAYDDEETWNLIGSKHTTGIFQISSRTYKQRMRRLGPKNIEQLAACLALVRGPCIASKADQKYMDIQEGKAEVELLHPIYDNVTSETNGILLYQEQFMQIFVNMGFSMEESYNAMKAAAKKKRKKLKKYEEEFMKKAKDFDMDEDVANRIFKILVDTGLYSFNKSHAIAYAILSYITAYFKVHYPKEFMAASLTNAYERKEKVDELIADCRRLGFSFLDLDINKSDWAFVVENEGLRIGFSAVKSFGHKAYEEIENLRPIASVTDLVERANKSKCGKTATIPIICSGAFDFTEKTIQEAYIEYYEAIGAKEIEEGIYIAGEKNRISYLASRIEFENKFLSGTLTTDPLNDFEYVDIDNLLIGSSFKIKGIYDKIKKHKDKNGNDMAFIELKTRNGLLNCVIFSSLYKDYKSLVKKNLTCDFILKKGKDDKYIINGIEVA